jgi:hypothetical protein
MGELCHRVARVCVGLPDRLPQAYRQAPVTQAAATGWRTKGKNGDAWLVAPPRLSLFGFRPTRAASVPQPGFGKPWRPGCLGGARDGGSNTVPWAIQYG